MWLNLPLSVVTKLYFSIFSNFYSDEQHMPASRKLSKLLDEDGRRYYHVLARTIVKSSKEQSISKIMKKYSYKIAALPGLFFEYVHKDCEMISKGSIGVGMIALSVSLHDDLTDEYPSNAAVYVNAGDILMSEGFRIFSEECNRSKNFSKAFGALAFHTTKMWECQQRDMIFFKRRKISKEEYFKVIAKSREWAKIGLVPAAILCGEKTNDYVKIGDRIGNIFQIIDDITEVNEDKEKYCTYFSCNLDNCGIDKMKEVARKMIDKENKSLLELLNRSHLKNFHVRLTQTAKNI